MGIVALGMFGAMLFLVSALVLVVTSLSEHPDWNGAHQFVVNATLLGILAVLLGIFFVVAK